MQYLNGRLYLHATVLLYSVFTHAIARPMRLPSYTPSFHVAGVVEFASC